MSDTEEKNLPPSQKKLRDARRRGQVEQSQETVNSLKIVIGLLYCIVATPATVILFVQVYAIAAGAIPLPFGEAQETVLQRTLEMITDISMPLYAIVIVSVIITSILVLKGFVFAVEPIVPRPEKINPVSGFGRIFAVRNFVTFGTSFVKVFLMVATLGAVLWGGFRWLTRLGYCGFDCVVPVFVRLTLAVIAAAIVLFILGAIFDILLQRWLFRRDMKMSRTEMKNEMKEMFGSPEIRGERRRLQREAAQGGGARMGTANAAVVIVGSKGAIALAYDANRVPVPVTVAKGYDDSAEKIVNTAQGLSIPVVSDPQLVESLIRAAPLGQPIPRQAYTPVARILSQVIRR